MDVGPPTLNVSVVVLGKGTLVNLFQTGKGQGGNLGEVKRVVVF